MKIEELDSILKKIEELKAKRMRIEISIEEDYKKLKELTDTDNIENAQKYLEKLEIELEKDKKDLQELLEKIEQITNWDQI